MPEPDAPVAPPLSSPASSPARRGGGGALLVGAGIFLSRIAGLVRERVFAHFLGNSAAADVFRAAVRIPNLLQNLFGEGVLSASFIPVYSKLLGEKNEADARRVAGAVFSLLSLVTAAFVVLGVAGAPLLVALLVPGFEGEKKDATVQLVRILFPGTGFLVLSAWCLGILNSHRRFFLSYVAPVVWNASIIAALVWGGRTYGGYDLATIAAWGVLAGCLLQFAVQLPVALPLAGGIAVGLGRGSAHVGEVLRNFAPVVIGRGVAQMSAYVDEVIASHLPSGALSAIGYASVLYTLPVSLFGMAVSASELPEMSREAGTTEEAREALRARLRAGLRRIAFLVVPSAAAFLSIGDVLVALVYRSGKFGSDDVRWVWGILAASSVGLLAATLGRLYSSAFYALRDTRTPLYFAITRVLVGTALAITFAFHGPGWLGISDHWGAAGITLGSALAAWLEFALLRGALARRIGAAGIPVSVMARFVVAAAAAAATGVAAKTALAGHSHYLIAAVTIPSYGAAYFTIAAALQLDEPKTYLGGILRRFRRR